ncbi:phospholipase D-like domain-containing protein [Pelagibacterium limicola]|uniref:phospholipase D-like domain-containing protein n=1 Tax=Pelagibacterium limicola TaxID=2791022 RepID=UPI0018AF8DC7|nr:phospholipase D-like domain-containing protein [Pelagibacterium limicola]
MNLRNLLITKPVLFGFGIAIGVVATLLTLTFAPDKHELEAPLPPVLSAGTPTFFHSMNGLFGSGILGGNSIETLVNGDEIFPAMLEAIAGAERSINFETYVYWSGEIGQRFAHALAERARAGVEVRVLLDWVGSAPMEDDLLDIMTEAGVRVVRFRPVRWYTIDKINNRTHRKILIVDGRTAFTGGVGIADEWQGDARNPDEWRETHYRVEGPVVGEFQGAFVHNWVEATHEQLMGEAYFPAPQSAGERQAQVVYSTTGERNDMHLMTMTALASARHHIRIGTPYFVPDDIALAQLLEARRRGVEIDILIPGEHTNKAVVRSASRHFWGELLEAGVRFHEFEPTMYHAKILIVDDQWASIGSANFDERSFRLNDELNLNVHDTAFAAEQIALYDADLARARPVTLQSWEDRPFGQKIADWLFSGLRVQL